jgi:hypothetical protein
MGIGERRFFTRNEMAVIDRMTGKISHPNGRDARKWHLAEFAKIRGADLTLNRTFLGAQSLHFPLFTDGPAVARFGLFPRQTP